MWYSKDRDKEWHSKDANTHPAKKKKKKIKNLLTTGRICVIMEVERS